MNEHWLAELRRELDKRRDALLLRELRVVDRRGRHIVVDGKELINLAGNDYLALCDHPKLKDAAIDAVRSNGTGAGASRLVSGTQPGHVAVEQRFAQFKHAEAALLCPTGYMANHAAVTALARPQDLICIDKLSHASLIDAAQASGATVRVYPHGNLDKLVRLLAKTNDKPGRTFIITDSVFSMDGDVADLPAICDLADKHGAIVIVDEAHGTGVLGEHGSGGCEARGVTDRVDVVISTASKALGGLGGIITSHRAVIDTIINHARSFIYTTAVPPAQAAAIDAALDVIRDEPWRRTRLREIAERVRAALNLPPAGEIVTPIIPVITGEPASALTLADRLRAAGFFAPAIRPPTVAPGTSRVRIGLRVDLAEEEIERLIAVLTE